MAAPADEFDDLRLKWRDIIVGVGYNPADPDVAARLTSIANSANNNWSSLDRSPARTFLWSDTASTTISSHITTSYSRLRAMALAYATPGCSLAGDAALLAEILSGLDWMNTNRYNASSTQYDNWWDWEIGTPLQLTDICVLLYDQLNATQRASYMNAVEHQTPTPDMTQANQVWKARVVGVRGCIVKSSTKIALARDAFSDVFPYVTSGDGFYSDGSFVQHTYHPYTAGYGSSLLGNMVPVLNWLSGSTWAVTDPAQANLYRWVYDSYEPIIYRGAAWDLVRGREMGRRSSSPQPTGHSIMDSILQISQFAPAADAARMKSMVKYWAQSDTVRDFVANRGLPTLTLAQQLMSDPAVAPRGELFGHYTFAEMDRVVHLAAGYGFGLSLCSSRIANFESINGENLRGWFTGDGLTTLYNADLNAFGDSYWATVDHYRLPGVTADPTHNKLPPNPAAIGPRAQGQSTRTAYNWVGGATLGRFGAAGMQLDGWGVTLTAKKSWFMFDDEVVCLGAGITSTDGRPIETAVENRKLTSTGANPFTVNGIAKSTVLGWSETLTGMTHAHLIGNVPGSDIGYYFPQPATLKAVREARTGAWADIDDGASATPITRNYLRLSFEHGSNPVDATYQYVLLPGSTARRTSLYSGQPHVTVLANNGSVQAVTESTLGITAANFWTDTTQTAGIITANQKCSVLVQNDGTFVEVTVSDPTQANPGTMDLQIATPGGTLVSADSGVAVSQTTPTIAMTVNVNGAQGRTFKARFYLGTPETVNVAPEADAYVRDGADAASNFGTATSLVVKKAGTGYNRESFLRFNVPAYTGVLLGASLKLMLLSANDPGVHAVAQVGDNSWIESGADSITWNTKPAASNNVLATWTPAGGVPVSADVRTAITGNGLVSFNVSATTQTTDGYVTYGSREHGTEANRPQLALSFGHTPPTVAITSPADGAFINHTGNLTITADAQPTDGAVTNVAFYDGPALLGNDTAAPYSLTADFGGGTHHLTAVAANANGLSRTSLSRRIDVAHPPSAATATVSTPQDTATNVDLLTLVSDVETPASKLRFTLGTATNGTVTLLPDGHTARFTPPAGYRGPATFAYTVTDTGNDDRTLLHYDFQTSDAADASGQGRDGTINIQGTGAITFPADVPAPLALQHTRSLAIAEYGTSGAVRVERLIHTDELDLSAADWSIAGWFKRSTNTNLDVIAQLGASGGYGSSAMTLAFYGTSDTLQLRNYNGSTQDVGISKTSVAAGAWHHFAIVRSGSTLSLYVNGTLAGSDTDFAFSFNNREPLKFGGAGSTSSLDRWLNGLLADLALFGGALSAPEIATLATLPVASFGGQSASNSVSVNIAVSGNFEIWQQTYFGPDFATNPAALEFANPDNDALRNADEFIAGTNPTNADAPSRLSITRSGSNILVNFTATAASGPGYSGLTRRFDLLSTTNTLPSSVWPGVPDYTNVAGSNQLIIHTNTPDAEGAFYQLQFRLQ